MGTFCTFEMPAVFVLSQKKVSNVNTYLKAFILFQMGEVILRTNWKFGGVSVKAQSNF